MNLHPCFFFVYSVVRHLDICINNEGVKDKLRIQVTEHGTKKIVGKEFHLAELYRIPYILIGNIHLLV